MSIILSNIFSITFHKLFASTLMAMNTNFFIYMTLIAEVEIVVCLSLNTRINASTANFLSLAEDMSPAI